MRFRMRRGIDPEALFRVELAFGRDIRRFVLREEENLVMIQAEITRKGKADRRRKEEVRERLNAARAAKL